MGFFLGSFGCLFSRIAFCCSLGLTLDCCLFVGTLWLVLVHSLDMLMFVVNLALDCLVRSFLSFRLIWFIFFMDGSFQISQNAID